MGIKPFGWNRIGYNCRISCNFHLVRNNQPMYFVFISSLFVSAWHFNAHHYIIETICSIVNNNRIVVQVILFISRPYNKAVSRKSFRLLLTICLDMASCRDFNGLLEFYRLPRSQRQCASFLNPETSFHTIAQLYALVINVRV